jgi:hypothetical protein
MLHHTLACTLAAALTFAALPAAAHDDPLDRTADDLTDPVRQDAIAGGLAAMTAAMLDLRVGPFLRAIDSAEYPDDPADIDPDTRLGDIAGPEARRAPYELAARVPAMMDTMGAMAGEMAVMRPELEAMARRMERAMDQPPRRSRRYHD